MTGSHTLVLGAGFGGLECATRLARTLPDGHRVTLVDKRATFLMGLAKLQMLDGRRAPGEGEARVRDVERLGIDVLEAEVDAIDVGEGTATVGGDVIPWDQLVVALGARLAPEAVPGLADAGRNLYAREDVPRLHEDLAAFEGGDVLFLVTALPFKCPPAPYEAAMLASAFLRERGVSARVTVASPEPQPLPIAGPACGDTVREWAAERDVHVASGVRPVAVDPGERVVRFHDGSERAFDLLAFVPPHVAPPVLRASGPRDVHGSVDPSGRTRVPLVDDSGWVTVKAETLETKWRNVWAIGDCNRVVLASGKPLVKAGVMAEKEGAVVAANIAARVKGEDETARFDGKGACFLELGDGEAVEVQGDFFATPNPVVSVTPPSRAALEKKDAYERETLARWFRE